MTWTGMLDLQSVAKLLLDDVMPVLGIQGDAIARKGITDLAGSCREQDIS